MLYIYNPKRDSKLNKSSSDTRKEIRSHVIKKSYSAIHDGTVKNNTVVKTNTKRIARLTGTDILNTIYSKMVGAGTASPNTKLDRGKAMDRQSRQPFTLALMQH